MPSSIIFLLCGILCGLALIYTVKNVKNRLQVLGVIVAIAAVVALAASFLQTA